MNQAKENVHKLIQTEMMPDNVPSEAEHGPYRELLGNQKVMNRLYRILRPSFWPVCILFRLQIGFKYGLQHEPAEKTAP